MFGFGLPEMIIILVIVVMVFGVGKIPELGGAIGKSIRNFKNAAADKDAIEINPAKEEKKDDSKSADSGEGKKQG